MTSISEKCLPLPLMELCAVFETNDPPGWPIHGLKTVYSCHDVDRRNLLTAISHSLSGQYNHKLSFEIDKCSTETAHHLSLIQALLNGSQKSATHPGEILWSTICHNWLNSDFGSWMDSRHIILWNCSSQWGAWDWFMSPNQSENHKHVHVGKSSHPWTSFAAFHY